MAQQELLQTKSQLKGERIGPTLQHKGALWLLGLKI